MIEIAATTETSSLVELGPAPRVRSRTAATATAVMAIVAAVPATVSAAQLPTPDPAGPPVLADTVWIRIHTGMGDIIAELYGEAAPVTVANFLRYVDEGRFEEGASFYRTVRPDNQPDDEIRIGVVQGGAARGSGFGSIPLERTSVTGLRHLDGTLSMARGSPDSATSEFFICVGDQPELDFGGRRNADGQGFAAFGRVLLGMDVVREIQAAPAQAQRLEPRVPIFGVERIGPPSGAAEPSPTVGGAVLPANIGAAEEARFGGVRFPSRADAFLTLGLDRWPDPNLGVVLHYGTALDPRTSADVHVRPSPGGETGAEALRAEFQTVLDGIGRPEGGSPSGVRVSVDTVYTLTLEAGGSTYEGHAARATLRLAGTRRHTTVYLFAKGPAFITVRVTLDPALRGEVEPRIEPFVRTILTEVVSEQRWEGNSP